MTLKHHAKNMKISKSKSGETDGGYFMGPHFMGRKNEIAHHYHHTFSAVLRCF